MQNLNVIYEDNHIIVVEKSVNIPSQCDKTNDVDMLSIIKKYLKEKYSKPGDVYLGLVHRLDRPVGGVMVFAKTSKAASRLSEQVRNKTFSKKYLVIVDGKLEKNSGVLKNYLMKNEKKNLSRVVDKEILVATNIDTVEELYNKQIREKFELPKKYKTAKFASLEYKVLYYNQETNLSLVEIKLDTGRHHQIRLQFNNINHSIYGDQKYGMRGKGKQINLWAYELEIEHPISKERMKFKVLPKKEGSWKILENVSL